MDKQMNKMVPLIFDIKTVRLGGYFTLFALFAVFIYHFKLAGGSATKYESLQTWVFLLSAVGALAWILPAYFEIVNPDSKELMLSLPINSFKFGFLRMLRLYTIYVLFILSVFTFIYIISDNTRLGFGIVEGALIAGALFFLSGLGLASLLLTRQVVIGSAVPIGWVAVSYFFRGGGQWYLHPCQWIRPKPFVPYWKFVVALWIAGLIFHIIFTFLLKRREYLMK
ncbi:hypothetical protein [Acetivibrio saccincola]|uniref:ABC-2 family transporter protein n=1 Tax=Acetivibrio saccincola TaxID=1677857 RepID=A0A2S8RAS8_9FIRM|nr:hypothetical protein [Acetivibrio saccincola]PQQ66898.1 hypothetical protein B9R14_09175 [Acetivibrio saccincola]